MGKVKENKREQGEKKEVNETDKNVEVVTI